MRLMRVVIVLILFPLFVMGATNGSKSLWHTQMAKTLNPGRLELRTDMNFYTKIGDFLGEDKPEDFKTVNYWDVQGNVLLTYGIMKHLDGTLMIRSYQDVHRSGTEANIPGDIFLDIKTGGWELQSPKFNFATILSIRFPSGSVHNYPFEPYAPPTLTTGIGVAFSYYNDPYLSDRDISAHFNAGFQLYNDTGKNIYETKENALGETTKYFADGNASAVTYATGIVFPTNLFDLTLEMHGLAFTSQPDSMVYSRENYMFITPGIKVKPFAWMAFKMGLD
ncbi:MAG: transporter, partial [Calditrichia bacterium]|nr:transporter [Calditrichia bacterium]